MESQNNGDKSWKHSGTRDMYDIYRERETFNKRHYGYIADMLHGMMHASGYVDESRNILPTPIVYMDSIVGWVMALVRPGFDLDKFVERALCPYWNDAIEDELKEDFTREKTVEFLKALVMRELESHPFLSL
jgi:hypothetical protein